MGPNLPDSKLVHYMSVVIITSSLAFVCLHHSRALTANADGASSMTKTRLTLPLGHPADTASRVHHTHPNTQSRELEQTWVQKHSFHPIRCVSTVPKTTRREPVAPLPIQHLPPQHSALNPPNLRITGRISSEALFTPLQAVDFPEGNAAWEHAPIAYQQRVEHVGEDVPQGSGDQATVSTWTATGGETTFCATGVSSIAARHVI